MRPRREGVAPQVVVVTGLSGAGKTQVMRFLEDLGFLCVDNLPPALIPRLVELCVASGEFTRLALAVDVRGGAFFAAVLDALSEIERLGYAYRILFLEATDEVLVRRFKETRRRHPLADEGGIVEGLAAERGRLEGLRGRAHHIVDTSRLSPADLRRRVEAIFAVPGGERRPAVHIVSFGFKHGLPADADLVLDVRFLPNPHYMESLRPLTGNDPAVDAYVMQWPVTREFLEQTLGLLDFLLPQYEAEGKSQLTIAVGCTGGRHRSVVIANQISAYLKQGPRRILVLHRDAERGEGEGP